MLQLFTDTDCDFTIELAKQYNYKLISMPYSIDGNEVFPYEDFETFDCKGFYDKLRAGTMAKTSAISEEAYKDYFEPVFKAGNDILYVHFSSAMSATFTGMKHAVDELLAKYPDRKFYTVDTKGISICGNLIAREVSDLVKNGMSAEEVVTWAKTEVDHFAVYFFADDLKFFARSGRVSNVTAVMGGLFGIRPIIYMGADGKMTSIDKAKGRKQALSKIMNYVADLQDDIQGHKVLIAHADAMELATMLAEKLTETYGQLDIEYIPVNPTAGAHCGPDCIGVCFHAIHR